MMKNHSSNWFYPHIFHAVILLFMNLVCCCMFQGHLKLLERAKMWKKQKLMAASAGGPAGEEEEG